MKKMITALTLSTIILGGSVMAAAGGPYVNREVRQQARIHQGIRSGAITPGEYRRLQHEQAAIDRYRHMAWSDGRLTAREAGRLHHMQGRAGDHIFRAKHNNRHKPY